MDLGKTAQLENLLLKVLPSVVISHPYSESLSQSDYRRQLQRCREVYDPKIRPLISLYRPEVSDHTLRDELSEFVALELGDYIRDGLIHSATIAFAGGIVNGSPVGDVVENLLKRAIVDGPRAAAQAFAECTTRTCFSFYEFFLLSGVEIEAPIHLFDGVELIPLPDSVSELPPHLPPDSARSGQYDPDIDGVSIYEPFVRAEFGRLANRRRRCTRDWERIQNCSLTGHGLVHGGGHHLLRQSHG